MQYETRTFTSECHQQVWRESMHDRIWQVWRNGHFALKHFTHEREMLLFDASLLAVANQASLHLIWKLWRGRRGHCVSWSRGTSRQSKTLYCCKRLTGVNNTALYVGQNGTRGGWENLLQNIFTLSNGLKNSFLWRPARRKLRCLDFLTKKMLQWDIQKKDCTDRKWNDSFKVTNKMVKKFP